MVAVPHIHRVAAAVAPSRRGRGIVMVLAAATLWGLSGTAAQVLFRRSGITPDWLVAVRMLCSAGGLMLLIYWQKGSAALLAPWRAPEERLALIIFALLGLAAVQYTYFAAIRDGNVVVATLLQYLGPIWLVGGSVFHQRRWPARYQVVALAFAVLGVWLLLTDGKFGTLRISLSAVIWGLASSAALAFYTAYPRQLISRHGVLPVVAWAMAIGGATFSPSLLQTPKFAFDGTTLSLIAFVVIGGTLIAFALYLASLAWLTSIETGLLASAEPLIATLVGVGFLQVPFGFWAAVGGLAILFAVTILVRAQPSTHGGKLDAKPCGQARPVH